MDCQSNSSVAFVMDCITHMQGVSVSADRYASLPVILFFVDVLGAVDSCVKDRQQGLAMGFLDYQHE